MDRINGEWEGYTFPAIVTDTTDPEQMKKIDSELMELRVAADMFSFDSDKKLDPLNSEACIELLDVVHACETMLRMYDQDIVGACAHIVLAKNAARGYYGEVQ